MKVIKKILRRLGLLERWLFYTGLYLVTLYFIGVLFCVYVCDNLYKLIQLLGSIFCYMCDEIDYIML